MKTEKSKSNNNRHMSAKTLLAKVAVTKKLAAAAREHLRLMKLEHKQARKAFKQAKKASKIARKEAKAGAKLLKAKGKKVKAGARTQPLSKKRTLSKPVERATAPLPGLELQTSPPVALATSMPVG